MPKGSAGHLVCKVTDLPWYGFSLWAPFFSPSNRQSLLMFWILPPSCPGHSSLCPTPSLHLSPLLGFSRTLESVWSPHFHPFSVSGHFPFQTWEILKYFNHFPWLWWMFQLFDMTFRACILGHIFRLMCPLAAHPLPQWLQSLCCRIFFYMDPFCPWY